MRSPRAFRWPQDSDKLSQIQRRREGTTVISPGLTDTLKELGIYRPGPGDGADELELKGDYCKNLHGNATEDDIFIFF